MQDTDIKRCECDMCGASVRVTRAKCQACNEPIGAEGDLPGWDDVIEWAKMADEDRQ